MAEIIKNRTIRPSSRGQNSDSYKIDTSKVTEHDVLIVNIDHESRLFRATFTFNGRDVCQKNSIHFVPQDINNVIKINWKGVNPVNKPIQKSSRTELSLSVKENENVGSHTRNTSPVISSIKEGLEYVADESCKVLILGTMPGEESLRKQQYYGNTRNLFWELLGYVIEDSFPLEYEKRIAKLKSNNIGLWDVCRSCIRDGSLDSNITDVIPNQLEQFIDSHRKLKAIAFNGQKAEELYSEYFKPKDGIDYVILTSSSPANASTSKEAKKNSWLRLREYISS